MVEIFSTSLAFVAFLSFFVGFVLLLYRPYTRNHYNNKLLAAFYLLIGYQCFITLLLSTHWIADFPHFYRTGNLAFLLSAPISYLYIKLSIRNTRLKKKDLIHFVPALLFLLDYIPFFLLPGPDKVAFLSSGNPNKALINFSESLVFPAGFYTSLRYVQAISYWILQVVVIYRAVVNHGSGFRKDNQSWLLWLLVFVLSQVFLFSPPFALLDSDNQYNPWVLFLYVGGGTGLTSVLLFLFPKILYGLKLQKNVVLELVESGKGLPVTFENFDHTGLDNGTQSPGRISTPYLKEERMREISLEIDDYFSSLEKPFLNRQFTLQKLSSQLDVPYQYLSTTFNEHKKIKYNDYVNEQRVHYAISLFNKGEQKHHTLESLAKQSGFNNRNSFTKSFKKITGKTPSEYMKDIAGMPAK